MKRFLDIVASVVPLILAVDEIQLLDRASLQLLDFLLAAKPGVDPSANSILFVFCYTLPREHCKTYYCLHDNRYSNETMPQEDDLVATLSYCHEKGIKRLPHYDFER